MRSLLTVTIVATMMFACGRETTETGSGLKAAADASLPLTYKVSYQGATDTGNVVFDANGVATVNIKNMPSSQNGLLSLEIASGNVVKYSGHINGLIVTGPGQLRRVNLVANNYSADANVDATNLPTPTGAQYCGGSAGNNPFDIFSWFNNGGNGGNNGNLGGDNGQNTGTPPPGTSTTTTTTSFNAELHLPK